MLSGVSNISVWFVNMYDCSSSLKEFIELLLKVLALILWPHHFAVA